MIHKFRLFLEKQFFTSRLNSCLFKHSCQLTPNYLLLFVWNFYLILLTPNIILFPEISSFPESDDGDVLFDVNRFNRK